MKNSKSGIYLAVILCCLAGAEEARAQYTDGPGIGKVTFTAGEVGKRIYSFQPAATADAAQTRNAWMFNGYLIFRHVVYDMGNPRQPKKLPTSVSPIWSAHVYPTHDNYVIEEKRLHDLTDLGKPKIVSSHSGKSLWRSLQWPLMYSVGTYGGVGDMVVVDFSNPTSPKTAATWNISQTAGFNVGSVIVIGNMMILGGSDRGTGKATLDLSDPLKPKLLSSVTNGPGMYFAQVYGDRIYTTGPTTNGRLGVYSFTDPTNIKEIWTGEPRGMGDYANFQGGYLFGASPRKGKTDNTWTKIHMNDIKPGSIKSTQEGPVDGRGRRYAVPFGNLLWIGSHTGGGEASLHVHQAAPDNEGPKVLYVNPVDGATRQALSSRIGFSFSDYIDNRSIMSGTANITVSPVGGAPIAGWLSHHMGIVNFTPKQKLTANTTYEVRVKKGGVRDFSNNTSPEDFVSFFSTGAGLASPKGQRPIASIKADIVKGTNPLTVQFDGAGSSDPDGQITKFEWNFADGDGDAVTGKTASHVYKGAGTFNAELTVTDNDGNQASATVAIEVELKPGPFDSLPAPIPGRIEAEHFDVGGEGVAYSDVDPQNQGADEPSDAFRLEEGVDIQPTEDAGGVRNVGYIRTGEWLAYTVNIKGSGTYRFSARVATPKGTGKIHLEMDDADISGPISIPNTGEWQKWQTVEAKTSITLPAGEKRIKLVIDAGDFNLNWIEFTALTTSLGHSEGKLGSSMKMDIQSLGHGSLRLHVTGFPPSALGSELENATLTLYNLQGSAVSVLKPKLLAGDGKQSGSLMWESDSRHAPAFPVGLYQAVLKAGNITLKRRVFLR